MQNAYTNQVDIQIPLVLFAFLTNLEVYPTLFIPLAALIAPVTFATSQTPKFLVPIICLSKTSQQSGFTRPASPTDNQGQASGANPLPPSGLDNVYKNALLKEDIKIDNLGEHNYQE